MINYRGIVLLVMLFGLLLLKRLWSDRIRKRFWQRPVVSPKARKRAEQEKQENGSGVSGAGRED